jgi:hypothetical protein
VCGGGGVAQLSECANTGVTSVSCGPMLGSLEIWLDYIADTLLLGSTLLAPHCHTCPWYQLYSKQAQTLLKMSSNSGRRLPPNGTQACLIQNYEPATKLRIVIVASFWQYHSGHRRGVFGYSLFNISDDSWNGTLDIFSTDLTTQRQIGCYLFLGGYQSCFLPYSCGFETWPVGRSFLPREFLWGSLVSGGK